MAFINDFSTLGKRIRNWLHDEKTSSGLTVALQKSVSENTWFTPETIRMALHAIAADMLVTPYLQQWLAGYPLAVYPKNIGVVMAGNIPLVGFHDFLCVLASGNRFVGKLSRKDRYLLPALVEILLVINPEWRSYIRFTDELPATAIDALIATGSDDTAVYFTKAAGTVPRIIRHNRRSVAILDGSETIVDLQALADDMLNYFGMGCRSVSILYVPGNYDWQPLLAVLSGRKEHLQHTGYANNYRYQKTILLMQNVLYMDASTVLLRRADTLHAPPAVVHYRYYTGREEAEQFIATQREQIQCVINGDNGKFCTFGTAQHPALWDYADGIDTMQWLLAMDVR